MIADVRTVPVRRWFVPLVGPVIDEPKAFEAWTMLVRAQGWSPVGEPDLVSGPASSSGSMVSVSSPRIMATGKTRTGSGMCPTGQRPTKVQGKTK